MKQSWKLECTLSLPKQGDHTQNWGPGYLWHINLFITVDHKIAPTGYVDSASKIKFSYFVKKAFLPENESG